MDFHTYYERYNTRSVKWDLLRDVFQADDILPMWVADMDFKAPREVNEALIKRAEHGIYGYTIVDDQVKNIVVNWINKRHQWTINEDWLLFSPGVIPSLYSAIQALTEKNDKVLIQTPVYTPFYEIIRNTKRQVIKNPLILNNNRYEIDFSHLEEQFKSGVKVFILCSPHNPVGRVWQIDELREIARLCIKYRVIILSDEIHNDIIYPNFKHVPIASLSEEISHQTITFMSPTKTFNLAGLQVSYVISENKRFYAQVKRQLNSQGLTSLNTMGITALEAAYKHGGKWLHQFIEVLTNHKNYVSQMFDNHLSEVKVINPEGTYLLWLDCKGLNKNARQLQKFMIEKAKVGLSPGISYGVEGDQFMRMNIACPKQTLEKGVMQMIEAIQNRS